MSQAITTTPAPLGKKLGAWLYDILITIAIYVIWVLFTTPLFMWLVGSEDLLKDKSWEGTPIDIVNQILPWLFVCIYFVYNHVKSGQTVGMSAWKLMLVQEDGKPVTLKQAFPRAIISILGLGMFYGLLNEKKLGWHDLATGTRVVVLPEKKK